MTTITKKLKALGGQVWQLFKWSIPSVLMYFCAGTTLMMHTVEEGKTFLESGNMAWTIIFGLVAVVYNAFMAYGIGGNGYEMLVSGNIKRASMDGYGAEFKMSSHKYVKEYRPWKGFGIGVFTALYTVVFGVLFGCNQQALHEETLSTGLTVLLLMGFLLSGWTLVPFYQLNDGGMALNYFATCAFAILPILISGIFYILGAYGKRNKTIKQQMIADRAAAEEAAKEKKINYGGLPGTKPKKRK